MKFILIISSLLLFSCNIQITQYPSEYSDVIVYWSAPAQRENGDYLSFNELGGYVLRYRENHDEDWIEINIPASVTQYTLRNISNDHVIEIAAFDNDNRYSRFARAE